MTKQRRLSRKEKRRLDRDSDHLVSILNQKFAMRQISPLTVSQSDLFNSYKEGKNLAAIGTAGTGKTMCGLCSRLRRGILYRYAVEHGVTRIALGHHSDDMMETLFLNMFHVDQLIFLMI